MSEQVIIIVIDNIVYYFIYKVFNTINRLYISKLGYHRHRFNDAWYLSVSQLYVPRNCQNVSSNLP